jgi:hypothetical protein
MFVAADYSEEAANAFMLVVTVSSVVGAPPRHGLSLGCRPPAHISFPNIELPWENVPADRNWLVAMARAGMIGLGPRVAGGMLSGPLLQLFGGRLKLLELVALTLCALGLVRLAGGEYVIK